MNCFTELYAESIQCVHHAVEITGGGGGGWVKWKPEGSTGHTWLKSLWLKPKRNDYRRRKKLEVIERNEAQWRKCSYSLCLLAWLVFYLPLWWILCAQSFGHDLHGILLNFRLVLSINLLDSDLVRHGTSTDLLIILRFSIHDDDDDIRLRSLWLYSCDLFVERILGKVSFEKVNQFVWIKLAIR